MLFNSYSFILVFLPCTLIIFHLLHNSGQHRAALAALALASLIFSGWWSVEALTVLLTLMAANYALVWCCPRGINLPSRAKLNSREVGLVDS